MDIKGTPFVRNDYWPDYNELNVLNARIDNAMNDLNNVNSNLTSDIADVQSNLDGYITAQATAIDTLDINALNVNAAIVRGDFGNFNHVIANNAYFDNLRVENPIYELDLVDPNITNLSVTSGNIYDATLNNANIQGASGSFNDLIINNLQVIGKVSDVNVRDATLNNVFITGSRLDGVDLTNVNTFENTRGNFNTATIGNAAIEYLVANHFTVNISQLPTPVNSGLVLGYDANGNIIPVFAKFTAQFPDNANYIWTDSMGQAFAGTAETSVAASDNLITSFAVYNEFQNTYNTVNDYFNDLRDNFNLLNNDVANEFNNIHNNFNVVNADINSRFNDIANNVADNFNVINNTILNIQNDLLNTENNYNNLYNDINQNLLEIQNSFNNVNNSMNNVNNTVNGVVTPVEQVLNLLISPAKYRKSALPLEYSSTATSIAYVTPANTSGTLISNASGFGAVYARMNGTVLEFSSNLDPTPIPGATIGGWDKRIYNDNLSGIYSMCFNLAFNNIDVLFPDSATNMSTAFGMCPVLNTPIRIPNNVTDMDSAFQLCTNFNQPVDIPDNVVSMVSTFRSCSNLNQLVNVSDSVVNMRDTFSGCSNFNQPVHISNNATDISSIFMTCSAFNQYTRIPYNVTSMYAAFFNCGNLTNTSLHISPQADLYMPYAYGSCVNLLGELDENGNAESIQITGGTFGSYNVNIAHAFENCYNLRAGDQLFMRGNYINADNAFSSCFNLNPGKIMFYGVNDADMSWTFYQCQNLNPVDGITLPNTNTLNNTFYRCYNLNSNVRIQAGTQNLIHTFSSCNSFNRDVAIPSSVINIAGAFDTCENLNQNIQLPSGLENASAAFSSCFELNQNIKVPDSVVDVSGMFAACNNLAEVTVGNISASTNVEYMFYGCSNLTNLYYYSTNTPTNRAGALEQAAASIRIHLNQSVPMLVSNDLYNSFINGSWGMYVSPSLITNEL